MCIRDSQSGDTGAGFSGWYRRSGRSHDYGFRRCGEMQLDRDDIGMGGDVFGLRGEARRQDLNLVTAGGLLAEGGDSFGRRRCNPYGSACAF